MERGLVALGFGAIIVLFVSYSRYQDPGLLTPDAIGTIQRIAYGFYVVLIAAIGAIALGMYRYQSARAGTGGLVGAIATATSNGRARRVFILTLALYGVFFSLASGTLVYQPEVDFAIHYGADIPSGFVSPCCDDPGYMPRIIIYITEHVGLQVIPANLVLQVVVSYLVALNAAVAVVARGMPGGAGGVGAAAGLFIACPTCAGTFLSIFAGAAGGIALSVALAQLQTAFIAVSIPVLLVTPLLMARRIRDRCG